MEISSKFSNTSSSLETCMQTFDSIREFRNGKRDNIAGTATMGENNSSEGNSNLNSHETNGNEKTEIRTLTHEEGNEQSKNFIAQLTRRLDYLIRLVQGLSVRPYSNHYLRAHTDASYNAHGYSPDTVSLQKSYMIELKKDVSPNCCFCIRVLAFF